MRGYKAIQNEKRKADGQCEEKIRDQKRDVRNKEEKVDSGRTKKIPSEIIESIDEMKVLETRVARFDVQLQKP